MIIEDARYTDENGIMIVATIDGVVMSIPNDPANRHWQAIAAWVSAGGVIAPYEAPSSNIFVNGWVIGEVVDFTGHTTPAGWLECYGQNVSRATYAKLFSALVKSGTITITIASPGVVTWTAHGRRAGDKVRFSTTGALPTGIAANTDYFVLATGMTANSFRISATVEGSAINTSGSQAGTHTAIHAPHGVGDGSTTFGIPDLRGRATVGRDNMGNPSGGTSPTAAGRLTGQANGVDGRIMGAAGGEEGHTQIVGEMVGHTHPSPSGNFLTNGTGANNRAINGTAALTTTGATGSEGGGSPFNVVQPSAVTYKIIYAGV